MLDEDLADLYGVETRVLVQQVRRNEKRFPADFMFQLSIEEFSNLKSQFVMSRAGTAVAASVLWSSPSKGWRCSRAFFAVIELLP